MMIFFHPRATRPRNRRLPLAILFATAEARLGIGKLRLGGKEVRHLTTP